MFSLPVLIVVGVSGLLAGFAIGSLTSKFFTSESNRIRELEKRLSEESNRAKDYRQDISDHYVKTAVLVDGLTESYRELHNHLAEGAANLLHTRGVKPLMRPIPTREQIDAISDPNSQLILPPLDYAPKLSPGEKGVLDEGFGLDKPPQPAARNRDPLQEYYDTSESEPVSAARN